MVFFYVIVCVCVFSFNETASDDFLLRQFYLYADMLFCVRHIFIFLSFPSFFTPFSVRTPQSWCTCTELSYSDSFFFASERERKTTKIQRGEEKSSRYFIFSCCLFVWPDFCYFPVE